MDIEVFFNLESKVDFFFENQQKRKVIMPIWQFLKLVSNNLLKDCPYLNNIMIDSRLKWPDGRLSLCQLNHRWTAKSGAKHVQHLRQSRWNCSRLHLTYFSCYPAHRSYRAYFWKVMFENFVSKSISIKGTLLERYIDWCCPFQLASRFVLKWRISS